MDKKETKARKEEQRRIARRIKRKKEERGVYLFCAFLGVLLVTASVLAYYFIGYSLAGREYRNLSKKYVFEDVSGDYTARGTAFAAEQGLAAEDSDYPSLQIDFASLTSINEDFIGWIYVPGADASYPLVQASDNDYYLDRTFERNTSSNGAIFMDYRDSKYLTGFNTFIYGHNMKNGSMFGSLSDYYTDKERIAEYPYFYIYLPDETVMKYQIFSYYLTDGNSDSYDRPANLEEEDAYLSKILKKASVKIEIEENRIGEYATLSTCAGAAGSGQRFLVHGACVAMYDAGEAEVALN